MANFTVSDYLLRADCTKAPRYVEVVRDSPASRLISRLYAAFVERLLRDEEILAAPCLRTVTLRRFEEERAVAMERYARWNALPNLASFEDLIGSLSCESVRSYWLGSTGQTTVYVTLDGEDGYELRLPIFSFQGRGSAQLFIRLGKVVDEIAALYGAD